MTVGIGSTTSSVTRPYRKNYNTIELAYLDHNESLRDALMGRAHLDIKPIDGLKLLASGSLRPNEYPL